MKKRLLVLVLVTMFVGGSTLASPLTAEISHTIVAADTVAASKRIDTAFSSVGQLPSDLTYLQFYTRLSALSGTTDTNWTNDTFLIAYQHSIDKGGPLYHWQTFNVDTFLTTDSGYSTLIVKPDTLVLGEYFRARVIHWDSLEAAATMGFDTLVQTGSTFGKKLDLWIIAW